MRSKLEKLQAGLASLPAAAPEAATPPAPAPARPARPEKPATVPVNLRMPEELRLWYVREAASRQAETGRPVTAQQLMLEALQGFRLAVPR